MGLVDGDERYACAVREVDEARVFEPFRRDVEDIELARSRALDHAGGALRDAAEKTFRGTIDFKRGASGAVGSELETVLMLGEDAVNKTVPVILCAEEDVVGEHGASIGALDEETLFYFESRGIGRAQAEELLARAAIERLARRAGDEEMAQTILDALEEELSHEGLS